ncbi:MAG: LysE family transporter [Dethiobacteria bacterium]|jgi:threonine/homoserine/homoserine lactone efflux protein
MLELGLIFTTALFIGLSGAMMPGPLTAVTLEHTFRRGYAAAPLVTLGHGLLEIAVVILLLVGLGDYLTLPYVAGSIGLAGGVVLAWMGCGMIRSAAGGDLTLESSPEREQSGRSPLGDGMIATASNPYWFLWWATIGAGYVALSSERGLPGVLSFFGGHILADFLWFSLLAVVVVSGRKRFTDRVYRWIIIGLGLFLVAFSFYFFWSGLKIILAW